MALFKVKPWYKKRGGALSYYGTAPDLGQGRYYLAATSIDDYAFFACGSAASGAVSAYDSYDKSLTRRYGELYPNYYSESVYKLAAASVGDYALFGGGFNGNNSSKTTVRYVDKSLSSAYATSLTNAVGDLAAASVGDYALFGGGATTPNMTTTTVMKDLVYAYNKSLTFNNSLERLYYPAARLSATSVGDYALFCFGIINAYSQRTMSLTVYDSSLTRLNSLYYGGNYSRSNAAATNLKNNYALFGGGLRDENNNSLSEVGAYDSSLTFIRGMQSLTQARTDLAAASVGDYALFGGGRYYENSSWKSSEIIDVYNASLTHELFNFTLTSARGRLAATSVGNYALFGGGITSNTTYPTTVEAFQAS